MTKQEMIDALNLEDFSPIYHEADRIRKEVKGDDVFVRSIIEFSNYCKRECKYCGINCHNQKVARYRMSLDEIVETAEKAIAAGYRTIVLQSGEDPYFSSDNAKRLGEVVSAIRALPTAFEPEPDGSQPILVKIKTVRSKAMKLLREAEAEAEVTKKEKIVQAKEKFLQLKMEHEKYIAEKNSKIAAIENKQKQRETALNQRRDEIQKKQKEYEIKKNEIDKIKQNLTYQVELIDKKHLELEKLHKEQVDKLESIAGISAQQAKEMMIESLKDEAKAEAMSYINEIMEEAKMTATKEAKGIIIQTIQRVGTETAVENAVTVFHIENDEIKGRIIGREGRNIRALEAATGVEIIVDDTPEAIVLSAFDPVRREIARLSLHQLVTDGRIHPARIEEIVNKTKKQVEEEIVEVGKRTCIDLGVHGLHPELIKMVGRMKYRSSYGQNLLQHSRETANLCAIMAAELGLNPKLAKRAGLLHDIGKVPEEETELSHAIYGMRLAERYKEKPDVCNGIGSHHDEIEMTSLISPLVQVCDAISGARPGARREIAESYIKRLKDLEDLALSYPGVLKTYAIQAGRELRVIVGSENVSDKDVESLSYNIAKKIQDQMTYPGQIKITVIRETRAVSYAK